MTYSTIALWCFRILWAVGALLLFGVAVIVHEFGHFLAAKLLGFQVDAFSVGFGPAIWKKKIGGVMYRIGWIPLGGYVALPQLDPSEMDAIQGKNAEGGRPPAPPVAPWKRIVVAVAGPLGNVVLAVVVAVAIYLFSTPENFGGVGVTVGRVGPEASAAGLQVGDTFVSLNGNKVTCWNEVTIECILGASTNGVLPARVDRDGAVYDLMLPVEVDPETDYVSLVGVEPRLKCQVGSLMPGYPAEAAGLRKGDTIVAIDGFDLNGPDDLVARVKAIGEKPAILSVRRYRADTVETVTLTPKTDPESGRPLIGIIFAGSEAAKQPWMLYRRPSLQLSNDAKGVYRILRALFAPRVKGEAKRAAQGMGGAATLFVVFWLQLQAGLVQTLAFLRYLCVNLAVINLLPLPVLDGGHVMFALLEMITRRKPSARVTGWIYNIFAVLLISLMAILLLRDVWRFNRMFRRARSATDGAVEEKYEGRSTKDEGVGDSQTVEPPETPAGGRDEARPSRNRPGQSPALPEEAEP